MNKNIHLANERGGANYDWLKTKYSFSFADYYNPARMGFGKIRVLNDDIIAPGAGFDTHPHDNMEIITIPLSGELAHKDSTGSEEVIAPGQIQVMSAGSGIQHSEYNHSKTKDLKLFQIWIETSQENVEPRHKTKTFNLEKNKLVKIVAGDKNPDTLFIYQDASIWLSDFNQAIKLSFETSPPRGAFILVIEGSAKIENEILNKRDSIE
ncbi:MAG: pirin family protein, partial [Patescibacteria group bacterium]